MQKNKKKIRAYMIIIPILLLILFGSLNSIFEYTVVAEIKESVSQADHENPLTYGKILFETRGCINCHSISPEIENFGPNLSGISKRVAREYIRESIVDPNAVIVDGFPDITMPNFGEVLNNDQVEALVVYVSSIE
ncbi:c-type cytochrome [Reichenbachiella sp.]|uniref:c-type cytochrome n=1 Tax=Reichenbachiella sp. TaxID=2184521 RepID=UPI003BAE8403